MKRFVPVLCLAAAVAVSAQTAPKAAGSAQTSAKSSTSTAARSSTASKTASTAGFPTVYQLAPGEKRVLTPQKRVAVLSYQDIKVGTGPEGESGKMWHVKYKGWRAADGVVFDNWEDHKRPEMDKDGKPVMGPDGKTPKMGEPEPLVFPQGMGRLIPGFDYGLIGMHVGGKRRLFIPWEMAYGTRAMPDRPDHPGIPAKSDLIFDVELVEVTDMPAPPQRPMMPPGGVHPQPPTPPGGKTPDAEKPATPDTTKPATPDESKPSTPPPASTPNPGTTPPPNPSTQPAQPQSTPQPK